MDFYPLERGLPKLFNIVILSKHNRRALQRTHIERIFYIDGEREKKQNQLVILQLLTSDSFLNSFLPFGLKSLATG